MDEKDFDINNDGQITNDEIDQAQKISNVQTYAKKSNAQRQMAWFSLIGMLLYPLAVVISSVLGFENASNILGSMSATYFGSVALIVAAFFGSEAYKNSH